MEWWLEDGSGWSPVLRSLLKLKRKTDPELDENQDGARATIIEEGIAMRAVDIDMIYMSGYGVPPFLGGPMFFADRKGLKNVVASMEKFASNKRVRARRFSL